MAIAIRSRNDVQVVSLTGEFTVGRHLGQSLDLQGRLLDDLRSTLIGLLDQGHRNILLDLGRVTFIDSVGLGELVACKKRTVQRGGDIKLLQPARRVRELLVLTVLTRIFEIFEDEDAAVASF